MKDNFQDRLEQALTQDSSPVVTHNGNVLQIVIPVSKTAQNLAQLFKDYIEDSQPDGMSEDLIMITMNGKPPDAHAGWTPQESAQLSKAWNQALQQYKSNLLEGLE